MNASSEEASSNVLEDNIEYVDKFSTRLKQYRSKLSYFLYKCLFVEWKENLHPRFNNFKHSIFILKNKRSIKC